MPDTPDPASIDADSEILIETTRIGNAVEVRAVSGGDGLEVAFTTPASAGQADINRLAKAKLAYVRRRNAGGGRDDDDGSGDARSRGGRGGILA